MIFQKLGLIHKNQRGVALIELLLAFLITGVITGGITMTIFQVFGGNTRSTNHMIAVKQVQNAGYWVSRDAQMAQIVALTADANGLPLTLTWTDWAGNEYEVVYDILLANNELQRSYSINGVATGTTIVAEYINPDPAKTNCKLTAGAFSLPDIGDEFTITDGTGGDSGTITVTAGSISVTGTGTWADPNWSTTAGQTIIVTATAASTQGVWTVNTRTATGVITADTDSDAILTDSGILTLTVTASVGSGSHERSETRVYEVIPRPGS